MRVTIPSLAAYADNWMFWRPDVYLTTPSWCATRIADVTDAELKLGASRTLMCTTLEQLGDELAEQARTIR